MNKKELLASNVPQNNPAEKIKVTVRLPENVRDKRRKINRIYDILKPKANG